MNQDKIKRINNAVHKSSIDDKLKPALKNMFGLWVQKIPEFKEQYLIENIIDLTLMKHLQNTGENTYYHFDNKVELCDLGDRDAMNHEFFHVAGTDRSKIKGLTYKKALSADQPIQYRGGLRIHDIGFYHDNLINHGSDESLVTLLTARIRGSSDGVYSFGMFCTHIIDKMFTHGNMAKGYFDHSIKLDYPILNKINPELDKYINLELNWKDGNDVTAGGSHVMNIQRAILDELWNANPTPANITEIKNLLYTSHNINNRFEKSHIKNNIITRDPIGKPDSFHEQIAKSIDRDELYDFTKHFETLERQI